MQKYKKFVYRQNLLYFCSVKSGDNVHIQTGRVMSLQKGWLISAAGAWLVASFIALLSSGCTAMGAPASALDLAVQLSVAFSIIIIVPMLAGRLALGRDWSNKIALALALFMCIICAGIAINMKQWCPAANFWTPTLAEWSDPAREWEYSLAYYLRGFTDPCVNMGYPILISTVWYLIGGGLLTAVSLSAISIGLTGVCVLIIARRLQPGGGSMRLLTALILFCIVPSLWWYGSIMMKETLVCLAYALTAIALIDAFGGRITLCGIITGALGGLLLMIIKGPMGWFTLAGAVIAAISLCIRKRGGKYGGGFNGALYMALVSVAIIAGSHYTRNVPDSNFIAPKEGAATTKALNNSMEDEMFKSEALQSYRKLLGDYYSRPLWERALKLPVSMTAQYMLPLPWHFTRDKCLGPFVAVAHLPFWYITGGLILGYFLLCWWRKGAGGMNGWALWLLLSWAGIALASGGSVGRYWLPLIAPMVPLGTQFIDYARCGMRSRSVYIYISAYILALAGALCFIYITQPK